jgi:hypothetical protein
MAQELRRLQADHLSSRLDQDFPAEASGEPASIQRLGHSIDCLTYANPRAAILISLQQLGLSWENVWGRDRIADGVQVFWNAGQNKGLIPWYAAVRFGKDKLKGEEYQHHSYNKDSWDLAAGLGSSGVPGQRGSRVPNRGILQRYARASLPACKTLCGDAGGKAW